jgi:O-antigen ligase
MDIAAHRPVALGAARDWRALARGGALAAFFVALACSISLAQALLAVLVLLVATGLARAARPGAAGVAPRSPAAWASAGALRWHPLTAPMAAFVGWTLLSAAFSGNPGWSFWIARDVLRAATFVVVLAATRDAGHATRLWHGFLGALTVMAAYGLGQAYVCGGRSALVPAAWLAEICTHRQRVSGPFSIYMTFGGVLLLGALFFLAYLANARWRETWWMVPAGAVTVTALALTYSRNAWLGLAAGVLGLVATAGRAVRLVALLAALGVAAAVAAPGAVTDRARSIVNLQDPTVRDRVAMWRAGLAMIADHPLVGVGPGEVRAWYQHYRRPEAVRPSTGHLHNSAIQIAAERGLPALAAWIWLWVVFLREGWRILRRLAPGPSTGRALVTASLCGVVGFLVAGLFEHNFGDGEVVMIVYALMALPWIVDGELRGAPSPDPTPVPERDALLASAATSPRP